MENSRFKFRVWGKGNKRYQGTQDWQPYLDTDGDVCFINTDDVRDYPPENYFIIEQCTGLSDKNGNLIYEGDIVEITIFGSIGPNGGYVDSDEIYKGTVVWDRDCFLVKTDTDTLLLPHSEDCIEIIGNIHEQAEQGRTK